MSNNTKARYKALSKKGRKALAQAGFKRKSTKPKVGAPAKVRKPKVAVAAVVANFA